MVLKPKHTSKTAKIILKLSVCVFLNIQLQTVILNYSTIWLLTPTLSKNYTITCLYYVYLCVCLFAIIKTRSSTFPEFLMMMPWLVPGQVKQGSSSSNLRSFANNSVTETRVLYRISNNFSQKKTFKISGRRS